MPKAPAEHFGMIQMVSARDVLSRAVISPPLEERCSLAPHPGCGTCTVEQALRIWANTQPRPLQSPAERWRRVSDPLKESYQNE